MTDGLSCESAHSPAPDAAGKKYPRWIQDPEWPVGEEGMPMKFVSQKRKKGNAYNTMLYTEYLFEDVKTGKQRTIEQFT